MRTRSTKIVGVCLFHPYCLLVNLDVAIVKSSQLSGSFPAGNLDMFRHKKCGSKTFENVKPP